MAAPSIYGDGSIYADGSLYEGLISSGLELAQDSRVRQTALIVKVLNEQPNLWDHVAGANIYPDGIGVGFYQPANGTIPQTDVRYWSYRGLCDMCVIDNGDIVRVRVGSPTDINDRQIWVQTITDPTNAAQWAAWSVLYSGDHHGGPAIQNNRVGGYTVFHCKNGLLYRNNVLIWNPASDGHVDVLGNAYKVIGYNPVQNTVGAGWATCISADPVDHHRKIDQFYAEFPDIAFEYDVYNYNWNRSNICGITDDNEEFIYRQGFIAMESNPRDGNHGIAQYFAAQTYSYPSANVISHPQTIRGVGGGAGFNWVGSPHIAKFSDGFYYLFVLEVHEDTALAGVTNLGYGLPVWMRSKDLIHWTDTVVGPTQANAWGVAQPVEKDGYIYWASFETVYRRPVATLEYDLSNYATHVDFELPRDNQAGSGTAKIANPAGINNAIKTLSDRELVVQPGLRLADGTYEYKDFDRFFIKDVTNEVEGKIDRLTIRFGNVWDHLDSDFRDVTNHIGQMSWNDFQAGERNQAFNYFFNSDTAPVVGDDFRLKTTGLVLYTGWKGHNPDFTVHFTSFTGKPRMIFRYTDVRNYMYLEYDSSAGTAQIVGVRAGVSTVLITASGLEHDASPTLRVQLRFNYYLAWLNNVLIFAPTLPYFGDTNAWVTQTGYVGFHCSTGAYYVDHFRLGDYEAPLTTEHLVRAALALGDFHDVVVGGADSRVYGLTWGPQTDAQTPAEALLQTLQIDKLQLVWKNGMVQVGKFNDQTPVRTIQDEVIKGDQIDQASKRINLAAIDGNDKNWIEIDVDDARTRGRMVVGYFDLPELLDLDSIKERAREEIRRGALGASPGGTTPLFFDIDRMDAVTWINNAGESKIVRVEGLSVEIEQGKQPSQHQTFDTAEFSDGSTGLINDLPDVETP